MTDVWGVTYFIDGSDEGVSVIELFDTEDAAIAFRDGYTTNRTDRRYGVTKFKVWNAPLAAAGLGKPPPKPTAPSFDPAWDKSPDEIARIQANPNPSRLGKPQ